MSIDVSIAKHKNYQQIGELMVDVYSNLDGFPSPKEQPAYYDMLANIGDFALKGSVDILMASKDEEILGAVVYINDLTDYGANTDLSLEKDAAAFRLLAVSTGARGLGIGKLLTNACLDMAKANGLKQMIIHTTESMKVAWSMYEKIGFRRSEELDFLQSGLLVYGFRLKF
ncbi:GNAT family N-acetyltransferase [Ekhidna sp.]|uniref:GNAT family N-acetyltransferase n=1 Tax=Ekhidna sp. TaxID=2608089 RepID=UPI003299A091